MFDNTLIGRQSPEGVVCSGMTNKEIVIILGIKTKQKFREGKKKMRCKQNRIVWLSKLGRSLRLLEKFASE